TRQRRRRPCPPTNRPVPAIGSTGTSAPFPVLGRIVSGLAVAEVGDGGAAVGVCSWFCEAVGVSVPPAKTPPGVPVAPGVPLTPTRGVLRLCSVFLSLAGATFRPDNAENAF